MLNIKKSLILLIHLWDVCVKFLYATPETPALTNRNAQLGSKQIRL